MEKAWSDFRKSLKRPYAKRVWVPLAIWKSKRISKFPIPGYSESFEGVHSLVVPLANREWGERYSWSDNNEHRPWATKDFYKPADSYSHNDQDIVGFRLALRQTFPDREDFWHLHQDFIIALGLAREGNSWIRPSENYEEVARYILNDSGSACGIEAKAEFLKDYLCARDSALRIASYREFDEIVSGDQIPSDFEGPLNEEFEGGRLEFRTMDIDQGGHPAGSGVAVYRMSRTDVDPDEDVPELGPETPDNTDGESWSFNRGEKANTRLLGDFWRDEWLEPGKHSVRVRYDEVPSQTSFIVSSDGERLSADELDSEDVGRWLWFKPVAMGNFISRRGAHLQWYSRDTGGISTPSDPAVHFGVNAIGLVTVYAYDIARLPEWERRVWAGFNVTPEGGVSEELLASQVRAKPASTQAPEWFLPIAIKQLQSEWQDQFGGMIFRQHDSFDEICEKCHRFRALEKHGLFALAKDLARLTADLVDAKEAQKVAPPPKGTTWASLKSLEMALASRCHPDFAHEIVGPLFATYELRLSDAHLPRSDVIKAYEILGITEDEKPIFAAQRMLHMVVSSLDACRRVIAETGVSQDKTTV